MGLRFLVGLKPLVTVRKSSIDYGIVFYWRDSGRKPIVCQLFHSEKGFALHVFVVSAATFTFNIHTISMLSRNLRTSFHEPHCLFKSREPLLIVIDRTVIECHPREARLWLSRPRW